MSIHTILGAGRVIADELAAELIRHQESVRLVSRHPPQRQGASSHAADITDLAQTIRAVGDSSIVYLCAGLKYDYSLWRRQWPKIMTNVIEACGQTGARLIFFDNVYMYGKVDGAMTEETPYDPSSRKGDLRARILRKWMIGIGGLFDKTMAELKEMLYQYESAYLFDSSKFEKAYDFRPVSYQEGIKATANAYKNGTGS